MIFQINPDKWLTNRLLKFIAILSFLAAILGVMIFLESYIGGSFLEDGVNIDPNPRVIAIMKGMIRHLCFGFIPALSGLLLINAILLWLSSNRIKPDNK
jgi:hypothetical protein